MLNKLNELKNNVRLAEMELFEEADMIRIFIRKYNI